MTKGGVPVPSQMERAKRQKAKQTLERERQVEAGTELPFTLLLGSATVARKPK
jgi:hypothetical protein